VNKGQEKKTRGSAHVKCGEDGGSWRCKEKKLRIDNWGMIVHPKDHELGGHRRVVEGGGWRVEGGWWGGR
jgi:hypothetical protein